MIIVSYLLYPICSTFFLNSQNQFLTYVYVGDPSLPFHFFRWVYFVSDPFFLKTLPPSVSLWLLIFLSPVSILLLNILHHLCHLERISCQFIWQQMYIEAIFWGFRPCRYILAYAQPLSSLSIPRPPLAPFLYFLIYFLFLLAPLCHCQISPVCSSLFSPTSSYFFHTPSSPSISLSIL